MKLVIWAAALSACIAGTAHAGSILDTARANGVVSCGAVDRSGVADQAEHGWEGLAVDVCRGVAAAVLGSPEKIAFHEYDAPAQYAMAGTTDAVSFLTASEIHMNGLAGRIIPGPAVYYASHSVIVPEASDARHVVDLANQTICHMSHNTESRSLENYFATRNLNWFRAGLTEYGEMEDFYFSGRCAALAGETSYLAELTKAYNPRHVKSRLLPETLTVFPVLAATPTKDGEWSAIVAWTVYTLVSAERRETPWYDGGAKAMPVVAPELGLDPKWQSRVVAAVGSLADIFDRNLGAASDLKLDRGINAGHDQGGLVIGPYLE